MGRSLRYRSSHARRQPTLFQGARLVKPIRLLSEGGAGAYPL